MRYLDRINDADCNPLSWLTEHLPNATALTAVVGYLDRAGVELVREQLLDLLERDGSVTLVVDARDNRPRRADLYWMLEQFTGHGERFAVRVAQDSEVLHSKVFYLAGAEGDRALVGSANFTGAGLTRNWESVIGVDLEDTAVLEQIKTAAAAWCSDERSLAVDRAMLDSYSGTLEEELGSLVFGELLLPSLDEIEAGADGSGLMAGIPTGFAELDRLLTGLRPQQLTLIAGRPSMGKSTLALDFARNAAIRSNCRPLFFSFEMNSTEMMQRVLSAEARVPLHSLRSSLLSDEDWTKLARRMGEISEAKLFFNDSCRPTVRAIAAEARKMIDLHNVNIIFIDYVQNLSLDRRVENRQQETAEISRSLKRMARELGVAVVVVSQLNREPAARIDKRPQLSDLRDSGGLEQDADVVILLHRDDYYDKESPRAGEADLMVAKHRNGPTDILTVAAQLHLSRFVDIVAF